MARITFSLSGIANFSIGGLKGIGMSSPQTRAGADFSLEKVFLSDVTTAIISEAALHV
jgi:hypothetical protein